MKMEYISTVLSALFFIVIGSETCCQTGRAKLLKNTVRFCFISSSRLNATAEVLYRQVQLSRITAATEVQTFLPTASWKALTFSSVSVPDGER